MLSMYSTLYIQRKKRPKKMELEPAVAPKEEASVEVIQRKPKTEIRKPKKSKKVEEVDPIVLRKRMRQLYKAVVNYQVMSDELTDISIHLVCHTL